MVNMYIYNKEILYQKTYNYLSFILLLKDKFSIFVFKMNIYVTCIFTLIPLQTYRYIPVKIVKKTYD